MARHRLPASPTTCAISRESLLSHDEVIGLVVALVCVAASALLLFLPVTAHAEEPEDSAMGGETPPMEGDGQTGDAEQVGREVGEQIGQALMEGLVEEPSEPSPVPSNLMPLVVVAAIMGVALAIALIVSHGHSKPQKIGGAKGDVW